MQAYIGSTGAPAHKSVACGPDVALRLDRRRRSAVDHRARAYGLAGVRLGFYGAEYASLHMVQ